MAFAFHNGENLGIYSFIVLFVNVLYFSNIFNHNVDVITLKSHPWEVIKLLLLLLVVVVVLLFLLLYQSRLMFTSSTKREIWYFHVVVVQ